MPHIIVTKPLGRIDSSIEPIEPVEPKTEFFGIPIGEMCTEDLRRVIAFQDIQAQKLQEKLRTRALDAESDKLFAKIGNNLAVFMLMVGAGLIANAALWALELLLDAK